MQIVSLFKLWCCVVILNCIIVYRYKRWLLLKTTISTIINNRYFFWDNEQDILHKPGSFSSKSRDKTLFWVRPRNITPSMAPMKIRFRQETTPRKMLKKNRKNVQTWNRRLRTKKTGLLFKTRFHFAWKYFKFKMLWEAISFFFNFIFSNVSGKVWQNEQRSLWILLISANRVFKKQNVV